MGRTNSISQEGKIAHGNIIELEKGQSRYSGLLNQQQRVKLFITVLVLVVNMFYSLLAAIKTHNVISNIRNWNSVSTRKLPVKNDGKIVSSEHLHCNMVISFFIRPSNPSTDASEGKRTKNSDFKESSATNQHTFQPISQATHCTTCSVSNTT